MMLSCRHLVTVCGSPTAGACTGPARVVRGGAASAGVLPVSGTSASDRSASTWVRESRGLLRASWNEMPNAKITQALRKDYAEITQSLRRHYAKITQTLRRHYADITQSLRSHYAVITQALRNSITQYYAIHYAIHYANPLRKSITQLNYANKLRRNPIFYTTA